MTRAWLDSDGQLRLRTSLGPLDILLRLPDGRGYDDVLPRSVELAADGLRVRLIDLPALIELKANTGRARDRMSVPVPAALLEAREGGADASAGPYVTSMARPARGGAGSGCSAAVHRGRRLRRPLLEQVRTLSLGPAPQLSVLFDVFLADFSGAMVAARAPSCTPGAS